MGNELEFSRGILEATLGRGVTSHQLLIGEFLARTGSRGGRIIGVGMNEK